LKREREREREKHSPNKRIIQHKKKKVGWVDVQEGKTDAEGYLRDTQISLGANRNREEEGSWVAFIRLWLASG
jgi:hypothetical protein